MPYHMCYDSFDWDNDIKKLCDDGFIRVSKPSISPLFDNKYVVFMYKVNLGIIELIKND